MAHDRMGNVAASVGFAGWAFAAMCDHALCARNGVTSEIRCKYTSVNSVTILR
jgi:hypothetical protein